MEMEIKINSVKKQVILNEAFIFYIDNLTPVNGYLNDSEALFIISLKCNYDFLNIDEIWIDNFSKRMFIKVLEFYKDHCIKCFWSESAKKHKLLKEYFNRKIEIMDSLLIEMI